MGTTLSLALRARIQLEIYSPELLEIESGSRRDEREGQQTSRSFPERIIFTTAAKYAILVVVPLCVLLVQEIGELFRVLGARHGEC